MPSMLARPPRTSRSLAQVVGIVVGLIVLYYLNWLPIFPSFYVSSSSTIKPANATLGFGALVVVSGADSPRLDRLIQAANVTGIHLQVPQQPKWTDQDVDNFRNSTQSDMGIGSILAWLAHNRAIQWFMDSGLETALILEDDVDFDINIRTKQAPITQAAIRELVSRPQPNTSRSEASSSSKSPTSSTQQARRPSHSNPKKYPYGSPAAWDLLYLGTCGDYLNSLGDGLGVGHHHPINLTSIPHLAVSDPTIPRRYDLHPFTASLLTSLNVPEQHRLIHESRWPLCTFGYALTRASASLLLSTLAPAREPAWEGTRAYDVAILKACRESLKQPLTGDPAIDANNPDPRTGPGLRCVSVQPELFHHMEGSSMIAGVEEAGGAEVFRPPVDVAAWEQIWWRRESANIGCGFWDGELLFRDEQKGNEGAAQAGGHEGREKAMDEGDWRRLAERRRDVEKGKCAKKRVIEAEEEARKRGKGR
ncbi:glycosyltransferase family 25 protein [Viridothelium virens]|uniref:Glycosyltransferase family 25 protein n=1 Tax=Viridothelium virens TaxID=1048519 RepID=A0A6A6H6S1_VIRVR|nr:glycosyltransferase family 25 protein [Viridothelium virens]